MNLKEAVSPVLQRVKESNCNELFLARGPVVSHLASSLQGLITIRAFNAQRVLTREFDKYQDRHSSIFYMNLTLHGAVRFWVDLTCTVYIAVVTFRFFLHQGDVSII
jgi:ABC-type multidrug transport system fused ATPase/permease subunit